MQEKKYRDGKWCTLPSRQLLFRAADYLATPKLVISPIAEKRIKMRFAGSIWYIDCRVRHYDRPVLPSYRRNPNEISLANIRFVIEATEVSDRAIEIWRVRVSLSPHLCASVDVRTLGTAV